MADGKEQRIRRSNTIHISAGSVEEVLDQFRDKYDITNDMENMQEEKKPKKAGKKKASSKKNNRLKDGSAKAVREIKEVRKPTEEDIRRMTAESAIEFYQGRLSNTIDELFETFEGTKPQKPKYASSKNSTKVKRVNEALKRERCADQITDFINNKYSEEVIHEEVKDKASVKKMIDDFMNKVPDLEYKMDTDEHFAASLEKNYELTKKGAQMKKIVFDAVDGGYMPEGVSLEAIQKKIGSFEELKLYLDARVQVVTNPYYKYFAQKDVNYTDEQIHDFITQFNNKDADFKLVNGELLRYLTSIQALREQKFNKNKSLTSVAERSLKRAKRQVELLGTRAEKKQIIEKLSDYAMNYQGCERYQDKDYDKRYSREKFTAMLKEFETIKVSDLHFKSFKDMADNLKANEMLFAKARDMEHMLYVAAYSEHLEGLGDDALLKLRAKIKTFDAMEKLSLNLQMEMLQNQENSLDNDSYEDIWKKTVDNLNSSINYSDSRVYPKFGENLEKYYKSILKSYKDEHKDRKHTIKTMYGLMNPVVNQGGNPPFEPGQISNDELDKRAAAFQKNAIIMDFVRNCDYHMKNVAMPAFRCFTASYKKKYGIDPADYIKPVRSMNRFVMGKSSQELARIMKLLSEGTKEEKDRFWQEVVQQARETDMQEGTGDDTKAFLKNVYHKNRMAGIYLNFEDLATDKGPGCFDERTKKEIKALSKVGQKYMDAADVIGQFTHNYKWIHGISIEDLAKDNKDAYDMSTHLTMQYNNREDNAAYVVNGREYANQSNLGDISKVMLLPRTMRVERYVTINRKAYLATVEVMKYRELMKEGAWEETKAPDTVKMKTELDKVREQKDPDISDKEAALKILEADLSLFNFHSYKEIFTKGEDGKMPIEKLSPLTKLAEKLLNKMEHRGSKIKGLDPELSRSLNERARKELKARCMTLKAAGSFFGDDFKKMLTIFEKDNTKFSKVKSLDEMLHMPDAHYRDLKRGANRDQRAQIEEVRKFVKGLNGFDIMSPLSITEKRIRKELGIDDDSFSRQTLINKLKGDASVFDGVKEGTISLSLGGIKKLLGNLSTSFKENSKLGARERETLLDKEGSAQHRKNAIAKKINEQRCAFRGSVFKIKSGISFATRVKVGDKTVEDISALMEGSETSAKDAETFIKKYAEKKSRERAMDQITKSFISQSLFLPVQGEMTDDLLANNAAAFESLSGKAYAYRNLLNQNPDYVARLKNTTDEDGRTDYDKVMDRLDKMLAYSDYYRAYRLLMTDHYYILHGNDELGMKNTRSLSGEERRVFDLMKLLDEQAASIKAGAWAGRNINGRIENVLSAYEEEMTRQAYLTGRPDLSKKKLKTMASDVARSHDNITLFLQNLHPQNRRYINIDKALFDYDPQKYPEAAKYMTEDVKNYIEAHKVYVATENQKAPEGAKLYFATQRQKDLMEKIHNATKYTLEKKDKDGNVISSETIEFESISFVGSRKHAPDEAMGIKTSWQRIWTDMALTLCEYMSDEEILDIVDGLTYCNRKDVDLSDEATFKYARDRWLFCAAKLYKLEYDEFKRFEKTYGTTMTDMPVSFFMHSLGSGQKDYYLRTRFSQNFTEICNEKLSMWGGKDMSLGEVLASEGLIDKNIVFDSQKNPSYYQQAQVPGLSYIRSTNMLFDYAGDHSNMPSAALGPNESTVVIAQNATTHMNLEGPKLSLAQKRKLWKDTIAMRRDDLAGGREMEGYYKKALGLYTDSEKKELKAQRAMDAVIQDTTRKFCVRRKDDLYKETLAQLKENELTDDVKAMVKSLSAFHPALYKDIESKDDQNEVRAYYDNVRAFCGLSAEAEDRTAQKKAAFNYFRDIAHSIVSQKLLTVQTAEDVMSRDEVRQSEEVVMDSALLILETCHLMYESLQDMAAHEKNLDWLDDKTKKEFKKEVLKNLRLEVARLTISSTYYKNLGDISGKHDTADGRDYVKLQYVGRELVSYMATDLDSDVLADDELSTILEKNGVRIDDDRVREDEEIEAEEEIGEEESAKLDEELAQMEKDYYVKEVNAGEEEQKEEEEEKKEEQEEEKEEQKAQEEKAAGEEEKPKEEEQNKAPEEEQAKEEKKAEEEQKAQEEEQKDAQKEEQKDAQNKEQEDKKEEEKKEEKKVLSQKELGEMARQQKGKYVELEPIQYKTKVKAPEKGKHVKYESQRKKYYCWACTMNGLINAYAGEKVSDLDMIIERPLAIPKFEESGIRDKDEYDKGVKLVNDMYTGKEFGNPAIFGDYIFRKLPNTAVRTTLIKRESGRLDYGKRRFLEILSSQLEKGPVGLIAGSHYVLVRELDGDRLKVNDSMDDNPDEVKTYKRTVSELFNSVGAQYELVWLESINGKGKQIADEYDIKYDKAKRQFYYDVPPAMNKETLLHHDGVEATSMLYDDVVINSIYVPKQLSGDEAPQQAEEKVQNVRAIAEDKKVEEKKVEDKKEEQKEEQKDEVIRKGN